MKKTLIAFATAAMMTVTASAQYDGAGYYRVRNLGSALLGGVTTYAWVNSAYMQVSTQSGTAQYFESLAFWDIEKQPVVSAPATVIYATSSNNVLDLAAQGTSVSQMTSLSLILSQNGTANSYRLSSTYSGVTLYLYQTQKATYGHYVATTDAAGLSLPEAYSYFAIDPIATDDSTNYFGITPRIALNDKYYAPFYAEFPFTFASDGMKAYIVSSVSTSGYMLEELTDEVKPGATPMLIECSSDDPSDNRLTLLRNTGTAVSNNKLSGVYFCNDYITGDHGQRTEFDATTMRVWNVLNGNLVLSTDTENLHTSSFSADKGYVYLNANESYLTVSSGTDEVLQLNTTGISDAEGDVTAPTAVSYTALDGTMITAPHKGQGIVVVRYSDGSVKKVLY